jgi:heme-degrading monooxygenase HmoA
MIIERAELTVKEGKEEDFAAAMNTRGLSLLTSHPGCHSAKMGRGVENPSKFILLVEWDTVESHQAIRSTPAQAAFRELISPFTTGGIMEHFDVR